MSTLDMFDEQLVADGSSHPDEIATARLTSALARAVDVLVWLDGERRREVIGRLIEVNAGESSGLARLASMLETAAGWIRESIPDGDS